MEADTARQTASPSPFDLLDARLRGHGIDTTQFGFHDQDAFMRLKQEDASWLETYAEWVVSRPRSVGYEQHVRSTVPRLCETMMGALIADRWEGSCFEASSMMVRMLDRLGVWSFALIGSTTFEVIDENICCGFYRHDFQDFPDAVLGHVWVVAPPYFVIDATVALQRWGDDPIRQFLPRFIAADTARRIEPHVSDVVSWRMRDYFSTLDEFLDDDLHTRLQPGLKAFNATFPALEVEQARLKTRYVPLAVHLSDQPLEHINKEGEMGRSGGQIWETEVAPVFGIK